MCQDLRERGIYWIFRDHESRDLRSGRAHLANRRDQDRIVRVWSVRARHVDHERIFLRCDERLRHANRELLEATVLHDERIGARAEIDEHRGCVWITRWHLRGDRAELAEQPRAFAGGE